MVAHSFKRQFVPNIQVGLGIKPTEPITANGGMLAFIDHWADRASGKKPLPEPKTQTIRAIGKRRHARPGELIKLRIFSAFGLFRPKPLILLMAIAYLVQKRTIPLSFISGCERSTAGRSVRPSAPASPPSPSAFCAIIWSFSFRSQERARANLQDFARADGFKNLKEMRSFWVKEHGLGKFSGLLIKWKPL